MSCNDCGNKCTDLSTGKANCTKLKEYNNREIKYLGCAAEMMNICDLPKLLSKFIHNTWCLFNNLIPRVCSVQSQAEDLKEQIDGMLGLNLLTLTKGTDYDITYYNGWSSNDVLVRVSLSTETATVNLACSASSNATKLKNKDLVATRFAHGAEIGSENWSKARVLKITFKGKYAVLNSGSKFNTSSRGILNVKPTSSRASWDCIYTSNANDGGQVILMTSYADGYNNQFSTYGVSGLNTEATNMMYSWTTRASIK